MFILDELLLLMFRYLMQHETRVMPKICMKYIAVTEHVNKNWCHTAVVAVVSYRNFNISVRKGSTCGSTTLWFG